MALSFPEFIQAKAYPFVELMKLGTTSFVDTLGSVSLTIHRDETAQNAFVTDQSGDPVVSTIAYWFAWYAFNTETQIFQGD